MSKDRGPGRYTPGNAGPDGEYLVGKGKPSESGKFRTGDGRQRGRRSKGTKNLATDLREELDARVTVTVGGTSKKITRQRAIVMRMADNATKGQNPAIAMALDYQQRLVGPLLAKEQEAKSAKDQFNWHLLSLDERRVMEGLYLKARGQKLPPGAPQVTYDRSTDLRPVLNDELNQEGGEQGERESEGD